MSFKIFFNMLVVLVFVVLFYMTFSFTVTPAIGSGLPTKINATNEGMMWYITLIMSLWKVVWRTVLVRIYPTVFANFPLNLIGVITIGIILFLLIKIKKSWSFLFVPWSNKTKFIWYNTN